MIKALIAASLATLLAAPAGASDAERALRVLLDEFLEGASANDAEVHDRFWADDLVYTSSSGERFGKNAIMENLAEARETTRADPPRYSARDVSVRAFDDVAVVTFRLVAETPGESMNEYFNTGVFRRTDGAWKAFTWQATRIPPDR